MCTAFDGFHAVTLVTEPKDFRQPDFAEIKWRLIEAVIFDCRNQYEPQSITKLGLEYKCVVRGEKSRLKPLSQAGLVSSAHTSVGGPLKIMNWLLTWTIAT